MSNQNDGDKTGNDGKNGNDNEGDWLTPKKAAKRLDTTADALREQLRENQKLLLDGRIVSDLGVAVGMKFGKRGWRVRIR